MAFAPAEQARIKHFLKYADWRSLSNGIQLGIPAGSQAMFLVEQSFQRLSPGGEESVRLDLEQLESIECQMSDARKRLRATALGGLRTNPNEMSALKAELEEWRQRLSDDLGAPINPYTLQNPTGGAANARVLG